MTTSYLFTYIKPLTEVLLYCDSCSICVLSGDIEGTTDEELIV